MNRLQFFILTGLASVLFLLLVAHIALVITVNHAQIDWAKAQQDVQQGQIFQNDLRQLAIRVYSDSQRTADPGLKDLLAREQITYTPSSTNATETPAAPTPSK